MDLITLAAAKKAAAGGESVQISTSIDTDKDSNTKAASPKAVNDFVAGKNYLPKTEAQSVYCSKVLLEDRLATKQNILTFDNAPTENSDHPVKSGGIYSAIQTAITQAMAGVSSFEYYLCGEGEYDAQTGVPTVQDPDTEHIYLVPTSGSNLNMYAYIGSSFTFLGTTEVDLSDYVTEDDLEDYALKSELPTVPTVVSAFTNDAKYITKPKKVYFTVTPEDPQEAPSYMLYSTSEVLVAEYQPTAAEAALLQAAVQVENLYMNDAANVLEAEIDGDEYDFTCNVEPGDEGVSFLNVTDETKPAFVLFLEEDEESDTGYNLTMVWTGGAETLQMLVDGDYLTEHQSLAAYTKTSGFHQVAFSGNYNHLNNKPTIPTVPTISTSINDDAGSNAKTVSPKAVKSFVEGKGYLTQHQSLANVNAAKVNGYNIVVQSSAPSAGTSSTQITVVVPE